MNRLPGGLLFTHSGQTLYLHPDRALFWEEASILIVSDVHLGKAAHFRKHGVPIPTQVHRHDLARLEDMVSQIKPKTLLFLGDLFHSDFNDEWKDLYEFRRSHLEVDFLLVRGNHDLFHDAIYEKSGLRITEKLDMDPFSFTHEKELGPLYNLSGHVHPGVRLHGGARQGISLPCFFFQSRFGLLPAFGNFTGTYKIRPTQSSKVFALAEDRVIELM